MATRRPPPASDRTPPLGVASPRASASRPVMPRVGTPAVGSPVVATPLQRDDRPARGQPGLIPLDLPDFKCFGCSPANPQGLRLKFERSGRRVVSEYLPPPQHQGWFGMVHGGLLAILLDELGAWTAAGLCRRIGVTRDLRVHYRRPLYVGERILLEGEIAEEKPTLITVKGVLLNERHDVGAEGEITVFPLEEAQFAKMLPGGKVPEDLKAFFPRK
ncbi:MAG: hotdog fold domain-containing protein [Pseudomonadota bacterium]